MSSIIPEQHAFLLDVAKLIAYCESKNIKLSAGEMFRTAEQQAIYFKQGKSKTMNSNHLKRLAFDLNFFDDKFQPIIEKAKLQHIGDYWESLNREKNRWGGNYKSFYDAPHIERVI